jgi:hypothetical protein
LKFTKRQECNWVPKTVKLLRIISKVMNPSKKIYENDDIAITNSFVINE